MTSREKTKTYLAQKEIPQLFESMMTGLMYTKPDNPLDYLQNCITKAKNSDQIKWNTFVEEDLRPRKTSPLPPITTEMLDRQPTFTTEPSLMDLKTTNPLPPISSKKTSIQPNLRYIFVIGEPGSCKSVQCERMSAKYAGYHHVSIDQIIKDKLSKDGNDDQNHWIEMMSISDKGQLISETDAFDIVKAEISSQVSEKKSMLGFIIEGYPCTMGDLKLFENEFGRAAHLLYLECKEKTSMDRLEKFKANNSRQEDDKSKEVFEAMSTIFANNSPFIIQHYQDATKKVNADRDEDAVFSDIAQIWDSWFDSSKTTSSVNVDGLRLNAKSPPLPPIQSKSLEDSKEKEELIQLATDLLNANEEEPASQNADEPMTKVVEEVIEKEEAHNSGENDQTLPDLQGKAPSTTQEPVSEEKSAATPTLKDAKVIYVIGGPGSGKGTQCAKIVDKYGFTHLSTGDLLREEVNSGSERGQKLTEIMEKGELVPQETVLQLLKESMEASLSSSVFLIDGYPREVQQGIDFDNKITECQFALYFEASDEEMTNRLLKRGETSGRSDDNVETIKKRLAVFHEHTAPVLDYYGEKNKLRKVTADVETQDDIFTEVVKIMEAHGIVASPAEQPAENATQSEKEKEEELKESVVAKKEENQEEVKTEEATDKKPELNEAKNDENAKTDVKETIESSVEASKENVKAAENTPEEAASEEKTEETASDEKAEEAVSEEKAEEAVSEEKAEGVASDEKTEDAVSEEKTKESLSEEKAEEAVPEEKTEEDVSEEKAEEQKQEVEEPEQASNEDAIDEKKEETETKEKLPEEQNTEETTP